VSTKTAIMAAGLPADTTFHDLRHTFPLAGHRSITATVDLYGHLVPEATGRARDALDSAFGRAGTCARNDDLPDFSQYDNSSHPVGRMRAVPGASDLALHLWAILGSNQ
jgi:hypothetical protein